MTALELSQNWEGQQITEEDGILESDVSYTNENVISHVNAAFEKAKKFDKEKKVTSSAISSEQSSCGSTVPHASSLPDSLDGGKTEVDDLMSLPMNFESALRMNQALQRRFGASLSKLKKALEENLKRQDQLKYEEEEQGLVAVYDKSQQDGREQYTAKPSSFSIPYFKDRSGLPAPMNNDAKLKVDQGYLDLYTTKTRTWLVAEQNSLIKEVQNEWKHNCLKNSREKLKNCEKKLLVLSFSEEEKLKLENEVSELKSHIKYFYNTKETKLEIPRNASIDWDKVAASAFDGSRSAEECKLLWENKLHPSINRENWSEKEDIFIQQTIAECNENAECHNWEEIANNLNTGRTAFQCMQRWVSYIQPSLHPAQWSSEDSQKLEDTISMLRVGSNIPWTQVSQHLTGFTVPQIQSRWRNINPEQARGPFTPDEDFMMIKGLVAFGLNFEMIAHYLPGRSKLQTRDRFKRTLLPGLTSNPWNVKEDKKIMANCSMVNPRWRTVATAFPKRDTGEIKMRYYTLHVWQAHSKNKTLPPPMFPLSETMKSSNIKDIREKLVNMHISTTDVNKHLDKSKIKKQISIKTFNDRRKVIRTIQKRKEEKVAKPKVPQKPKIKRKSRNFGPRTPSWPDMALIEYFLPGRPPKAVVELPKGKSHRNYMDVIAQSLQLKLTQTVSDELIEDYYRLNLTDEDAFMIDQIAVEHSHETNENDSECGACERLDRDRPPSIPLIPPNQTTIGAFRSFLFNKTKVNEMASKEFLFFQIPKDQLNKLGTKPNTMLTRVPGLEDDQRTARIIEERVAILVADTDKILSANEEMNASGSGSKIKRKAATKAKIKNLVFTNKGVQKSIIRDQLPNDDCDAIEVPSDQEFRSSLTESELPYLCSRQESSKPKKEIMAEEDELLFQRLMAIFFWPALFTLKGPSMTDFEVSEMLTKELMFKQQEHESENVGKYLALSDAPYPTSKFRDLDISEQEQLIMDVEKEVKRKATFYAPLQLSKKIKLEDGSEMDYMPPTAGSIVNRKNLTALKRSLVMKKLWAGRRNGVIPERQKRPLEEVPEPHSARLRNRISKGSTQDSHQKSDSEES